MGTLATDLPIELQTPAAKYRTIAYIRELGLPTRHKRAVLQHWGERQGVSISADDYALVASPATQPAKDQVREP